MNPAILLQGLQGPKTTLQCGELMPARGLTGFTGFAGFSARAYVRVFISCTRVIHKCIEKEFSRVLTNTPCKPCKPCTKLYAARLSVLQGCLSTLHNPVIQKNGGAMSKKGMRAVMPETAAWIDSLREAFGADAIDAQIRKGMRGQPTFWACENGHEIGTRQAAPDQAMAERVRREAQEERDAWRQSR